MKTFIDRVLLWCSLVLISTASYAQVSVTTNGSSPDPSAMLDVKSTTQGFLVPRMSTSERNAITAPAEGLMVYDTDLHALFIYHSGWKLTLDSNTGWLLTGNSGTDPSANFLGTTDNVPLKFRTNNLLSGLIDPVKGNVGLGNQALMFIYTGQNNTALGALALGNTSTGWLNVAVGCSSAFQNTEGSYNVSVGANSLTNNSTGYYNVAIGFQAMNSNTTGDGNVAIGCKALFNSTDRYRLVAIGDSALYNNGIGATGDYMALNNTAVGATSLYANTTGYQNTACGISALRNNTTGFGNVAMGCAALFNNVNKNYLVAIGDSALFNNGVGSIWFWQSSKNTAVGAKSLYANTAGYCNTAIGINTLFNNTTGWANTSIGDSSLYSNLTGSKNTAIGYCSSKNSNFSNNTCIGYYTGSSYNFYEGTFLGSQARPDTDYYSNCMALGYGAIVNGSNKVVVGNTSITSIGGQVGWTTFSDGRFKTNLNENIPGLAFIDKLRPVSYTLKITDLNAALDKNRQSLPGDTLQSREIRPEDKDAIAAKEKIVYTGFIAQEVEEVAKSIGYDFSGIDAPQDANGYYGLRYSEFVVPLVKAVQELSARNEELKAQNQELEKRINSETEFLQSEIDALKARLDN